MTLDRLFGGGGGALFELILSEMLRVSLSSFADAVDVCVLLRVRTNGREPCRLALRAKGIVGGIFFGGAFSETSLKSNDLLGDSTSLSMDAESRLEGLGGGGNGLFRSVLVGEVGEALDKTIGTLEGLGDENDGLKSAKETICGPWGATALP